MTRDVTTRRKLQQTMHCVQEALAVIETAEHPTHALSDIDQALALLEDVRPVVAQTVDELENRHNIVVRR